MGSGEQGTEWVVLSAAKRNNAERNSAKHNSAEREHGEPRLAVRFAPGVTADALRLSALLPSARPGVVPARAKPGLS